MDGADCSGTREEGAGGAGYSGSGEEGAGGIQFNPPTQKGLQQAQEKVDEVFGVIQCDFQKIVERGEKLSELDNRVDALQQWAAHFKQGCGKVKKKYWWRHLKWKLIIGTIALLLLVILIVSVALSVPRSEPAALEIHASTIQNSSSQ
jgi:hypothetical protein